MFEWLTTSRYVGCCRLWIDDSVVWIVKELSALAAIFFLVFVAVHVLLHSEVVLACVFCSEVVLATVLFKQTMLLPLLISAVFGYQVCSSQQDKAVNIPLYLCCKVFHK